MLINNKNVYPFESKLDFLNFIDGKKKILIALNAEKLNARNQELDKIINKNIGYADGIGAVLALKRKGIRSVKIAGAEFWLDVVRKFHKTKTFYLLGSTQQVIEKTVSKLEIAYPNVIIKGYRNGYLNNGDENMVLLELIKEKPDIVFVAMGSPRQEFVMDKFIKRYPALYMGLGGSFDVYCGEKKRAPKVIIKLGLEWLFRLLKEPTRISRQLNLFQFFLKIVLNKI
ncbi:WecB/TagA/CpsF family glycosyltransferase [Arenibacter sp. GZD96]|uniref:WecB/TagA/CpsF family glycosyltransferase n=1 Tax=Aurantibrevibacter litoralis TaxID=3106030 RepID=UPI002AFFCD70|nr:WecB/TagA/CpsF family glycosyltransferase [Arenibacter sp. GZD-96]MEA1786443.1 WecB/TagA/CpsF family glycosyltransferase [Arenibacter sp. GZD-96]